MNLPYVMRYRWTHIATGSSGVREKDFEDGEAGAEETLRMWNESFPKIWSFRREPKEEVDDKQIVCAWLGEVTRTPYTYVVEEIVATRIRHEFYERGRPIQTWQYDAAPEWVKDIAPLNGDGITSVTLHPPGSPVHHEAPWSLWYVWSPKGLLVYDFHA